MNDDRQAGSAKIGGGGEWTALRELAAKLRITGGRLRTNLHDFFVWNPERFNKESLTQLLGQWDELVAKTVQTEMALAAAAPAPPASQTITDCEAILSLMGKEPYLAKGHVEDGEFKWTIIADKVSVTELLRQGSKP